MTADCLLLIKPHFPGFFSNYPPEQSLLFHPMFCVGFLDDFSSSILPLNEVPQGTVLPHLFPRTQLLSQTLSNSYP